MKNRITFSNLSFENHDALECALGDMGIDATGLEFPFGSIAYIDCDLEQWTGSDIMALLMECQNNQIIVTFSTKD